MYNRDCFSGVGGTFYNVDYKTKDVSCDDLTGTNACVVKTVRPMRKEVCNKKLNFISPNKRIGTNEINIKKVNKVLCFNINVKTMLAENASSFNDFVKTSVSIADGITICILSFLISSSILSVFFHGP